MKPRIFVGSAKEHLQLLENLQCKNEHAPYRYHPWTNLSVFPQGAYAIPSLVECLRQMQGAVFLAFGEDVTWWRDGTVREPRDNVIFEIGLAFGLLGAERVFVATDIDSKLPSDFLGYQPQAIRFSGDPAADADDLHVHIKSFFQRALAPHALSVNKPDRLPEVTWTRLAFSFPEFEDRQIQRSIALLEESRFAEAEAALEGRDNIASLYLQSRIALLCGDFPTLETLSKDILERGIESIKSGNRDAYWFVETAARRLIKVFDYVDLVRDALARLSRIYHPADLHHLQGHVELQAKRYEEAIRHYDNAIASGSAHMWTHLDRAECYYKLGKKDQLVDALRTVERLWPESIHGSVLFHYLDAPRPTNRSA